MKKITIITSLLLILTTVSSFAQMRLSLQAGVQIPTSDFAESAGAGFGAHATFEYWQNTALSFTGTVGYNTWGPKDDLPPGRDYNVTAVPILIGLRYYLATGPFHPYLGAELGLYIVSIDVEQRIGNTIVSTEDSETKFGLAPVFGFRYHISQSVDLDFNFKYNIITTEENSTTYMGINGGIQFGL